MERDQLSWAYREYSGYGQLSGGPLGWHYRGVGTDICYAWEPQPSGSSEQRAKSGRRGSGHLSRDWDTELGHPF